MRSALLLAMLLLAAAGPDPVKPDAAPQSVPDAWQPRDTAELVILDKVNAKATNLTLKVGQAAENASLSFALRACVARPPDLPKDSAAFFDIVDSRPGAPAFHGWILANEPSVSMFQHPIYDVRLAACH